MPKPSSSPLSGLPLPKPSAAKSGPLWQGPEATGPLGGITFSMLSKWLTCRRRFQVRYVEGWEATKHFNHRIEYGNMWHVCEEALASLGGRGSTPLNNWGDKLKQYVQELCRTYPLSQEEIVHWYNVCKVQFPVYVDHWSKHPDVTNRTPLEQEKVFDVSYTLPSGRVVRLRGKRDSVDVVQDGKDRGIYLMENKTKGDIDELALQRQLTFDLQTMLYMVALSHDYAKMGWAAKGRLAGVRYNVVRRPLSGGEGSIVQREATKGSKCPRCKGIGQFDGGVRCEKCAGAGRIGAKPGETDAEYYARVKGVIDGTGLNSKGEHYTGPSHFFMRWKFDVTARDIKRFKDECLDPILEQLCWWYDSLIGVPASSKPEWEALVRALDYRHPFGCDNAVDNYGATDVDNYLNTGSTVGLHRRETLFEELR